MKSTSTLATHPHHLRAKGERDSNTKDFQKILHRIKSSTFLTALIVFLILTMIEGLAFIHTYGPFTSPDYNLHATSSYALATGQSFNHVGNASDPEFAGRRQYLNGDARILDMSNGRNATVESINVTSLGFDDHHEAQYFGLDTGPYRPTTITARSNQYLFISYIPQAIGMRIGLSLNLRPSTVMALGRVCNLLAYLLLFSAAIILIPRGKGLIAAIGILPVSVFCGSSLMADGFIIGFSAFFIALSFNLYERKSRLSSRGLVILTATAVFLCLLKYVYAPFILLPLVARYALDKKQKTIFLSSTIVISSVIVIWWQSVFAFTPKPEIYAHNKGLLLARPIQTIFRLLANDFIVLFNISKDTQIIIASLILVGFVLTITLRNVNPDRFGEKRMLYFTCCFAAVGTATLISLSLFLTWNQPSEMAKTLALQGFQMRYLYPLLPMLLSLYIYKPSDTAHHREGTPDKIPASLPAVIRQGA